MAVLRLMAVIAVVGSSACTFLESIEPVCGNMCGPCDLGRWDCGTQTCDVGNLDQVLADVSCERVFSVDAQIDGLEAKSSIEDAVNSGAEVIILGVSTIVETVSLKQNVALIGGYKSPGVWDGETIIQSPPGDETLIDLQGVTSSVIRRIHFQSAATSIQLGVVASESEATFFNCRFSFAEPPDSAIGLDGVDGSAGRSGESPSNFNGGLATVNEVCPIASGAPGGQGGQDTPNGIIAPSPGDPNQNGLVGGGIGERGRDGAVGTNGPDGVDGVWSFVSGLFETSEPLVGEDGSSGFGGSGGGGFAHDMNGDGLGGGGGGSGGCGGKGGFPGGNGSVSIGILASSSSLRFVDSVFEFASIDPGSAGGQGGAGGDGGRGAGGLNGGGDGGDGGPGGTGGLGFVGFRARTFCDNSIVLDDRLTWKNSDEREETYECQ